MEDKIIIKRCEPIGEIHDLRYHVSLGKNKISVIKFKPSLYDGYWEIYQLEGKDRLFEDVERFKNKVDAMNQAKLYLQQNAFDLWIKNIYQHISNAIGRTIGKIRSFCKPLTDWLRKE